MVGGWWSKRSKKTNDRKDSRGDRVDARREFRLEKIAALTKKFYAVAAKRKWLVFLVGILLIAYFVVSSGGLGGFGGIIDKVKGFFS